MNYILLSDCYVDCFPKVSSRVRKYCLTDKSDKESSCYSFAPDAESDQFIRKHKFAIGLNVLKKDLNNGSKGIQARFYEVVSDFRFYKNITCRSLGCEIRCPIKPTTRLGEAYSQKNVQDPESKRFVFWSYLVARVALIVIISTEMALLKAAILTIVDRNDTEYGYQRVWSSLAAAAVPPLAGMLMDKLRASGDPDAYYPCFYVYSGFKVFMAAVALSVDMKCKTPSVEIWARVTQLIRNKEVAILLVFVTIIGSIWGFIETFIVWYLQELQASRTMIGLTFTISALSGIPFTIMAGWLQKKFGHVPILIIGLSAYSIRLLGYSYATTAYQVLALETLEGITSSLVIVIITTYSTVLSTHDLVATMQATWAALHFSVGRAIGSGTGGVLMDNLGPVVTYRIYAFVCVLSAMTYLVIYLRWLRKKELERRRDGNKDGKEDTGVKDLSLVAGDVHVGKNGEIIYSLKSSGKEDDGKEKQGVVNEAMDKTE
ncbi:Major facilitator superfamily domain-containing protein 6 [Halotydeus destructor]|nr:Major facilitator superfamily domain-containing protein 6 [Halotydeus destructor]